jgi:hypothetical protein
VQLKDLKGRKSLVPSPGYIRAFELYQKPRCRECGRPLHAESSIRRGFGTTCGMLIADKYLGRAETYFGEHAQLVIKNANKKTKEIVDKIRKQEIKALAEAMFSSLAIKKEKK